MTKPLSDADAPVDQAAPDFSRFGTLIESPGTVFGHSDTPIEKPPPDFSQFGTPVEGLLQADIPIERFSNTDTPLERFSETDKLLDEPLLMEANGMALLAHHGYLPGVSTVKPCSGTPVAPIAVLPLVLVSLLLAAWVGWRKREKHSEIRSKNRVQQEMVMSDVKRWRELGASMALGVVLALLVLRVGVSSYSECLLKAAPATEQMHALGMIMQACAALYGQEDDGWSATNPGSAADLALILAVLLLPVTVCWLLRCRRE